MPTNLRIAMMFLVGFSIAGSLFIFITDDAEGIGHYPIGETDNNYPSAQGNDRATHTKDDTLVWGLAPDADSIVVTYKESGEDWANYTIHTDGDDNSYKFAGVVNTRNNTVVMLYCVKITTYVDVYIAIKWPGDDWDTWTMVEIGNNRLPGDIGVNDTDIIGIVNTKTTSTYNLYLWYFDLETMTKDPDDETGSSTSEATSHFATVQVHVNLTGVFFYSYQHTSWGNRWRDFEQTFASQTVSPVDFFLKIEVLVNDMFIGVGLWRHTGRPYIYRQTSILEMGWWTRTYLEQSGSGCTFEYDSIDTSLTQNSTFINIVAYCDTHEEVVTWSRQWDSTELQWDAAKSETGISDPDDLAFLGNFGGLYPVHPSTGIPWTQLQGGWALFARNESGAIDTFDLWYDSINFTVDLTTDDPEITTESLTNAEYGVFYSLALTKIGGTIPHSWSLLVGPEWMSIGTVNGTIYGTPDGTGTEQVKVRLQDAVPRSDEVEWTLTIGAASEGGEGSDFDPSVAWALWWGDVGCISSFMVVAVIVLIGFLIIRSRI